MLYVEDSKLALCCSRMHKRRRMRVTEAWSFIDVEAREDVGEESEEDYMSDEGEGDEDSKRNKC